MDAETNQIEPEVEDLPVKEPEAPRETRIKVQDLVKVFQDEGRGQLTAVANVSFECYSGEIFGLLGTNGAGKTTFIRILNQILAPDEGEVLIKGEALSGKHISRIGYLPEERGLYPKGN